MYSIICWFIQDAAKVAAAHVLNQIPGFGGKTASGGSPCSNFVGGDDGSLDKSGNKETDSGSEKARRRKKTPTRKPTQKESLLYSPDFSNV